MTAFVIFEDGVFVVGLECGASFSFDSDRGFLAVAVFSVPEEAAVLATEGIDFFAVFYGAGDVAEVAVEVEGFVADDVAEHEALVEFVAVVEADGGGHDSGVGVDVAFPGLVFGGDAKVGDAVVAVFEVVAGFAAEEEVGGFAVGDGAEAFGEHGVAGVDVGGAVVAMVGVVAVAGIVVVLAFVVEHACGAEFDEFVEFGVGDFAPFGSEGAHGGEAAGVDSGELGEGVVFVAGVVVGVAVGVFGYVADEFGFEVGVAAVGPGEFAEEDDLDSHSLDFFDGVAEFFPGAKAGIGVVGGIAPVLSAVVPADELDGGDAVLGTFFA